jgi:hypothetical protein
LRRGTQFKSGGWLSSQSGKTWQRVSSFFFNNFSFADKDSCFVRHGFRNGRNCFCLRVDAS